MTSSLSDRVVTRLRPAAGKLRAAQRRRAHLSALAEVRVSGVAPTATIRALRAAAHHRPAADERDWIARIELLRALLLRSPQPLEIVDFGAGTGSEFDTGQPVTGSHTTTRTLGEMARASKPPQGGYLLFELARELRPASVLELGACVGVSASYLGAALELNDHGRLATLEGAPVLARRTARTLEEFGLEQRVEVREGPFADTLAGAVADLAPVDLAFIDGHHVEAATLDYLEAIAPSASGEAVLVFDDISWSEGMRRAWETIAADERFALTVDFGAVGLAVISASATAAGAPRQTLTLPAY